ncbi:DUF1826 domain-containing protein [Methyloceanibacter sp. wino2]|uniref:DUF1826 domain-containing protein n=1 Tax=Methyloceanibacter sp. wino2 TaxID=2170729 RepID=UPI001ABBA2CF|nr:DUF1826 domain-containing protein [Methyloceanibacter sp. wino2]
MDGQAADAVGVLREGRPGQEARSNPRQDRSEASGPAKMVDARGGTGGKGAPAVACRVVDQARAGVLDEIWSPGCAAAIWRRELPSHFQAWIDTLEPDSLPDVRIVVPSNGVHDALCALFDEQGVPASEGRATLARDAAELASTFARIMNANTVRLRLDVIGDNACRKFHVDNVAARLLCTYRGRGTQYGRVRSGGDPSVIHELPAGAVGLFRGALWPSMEETGIVHRSPPISGSGETRLLLVIDPVSDVS